MNMQYVKATVYLRDNQKKILQKYMPHKMSAMIRDILDLIIKSDLIDSKNYGDNPELIDLVYSYKQYLESSQDALKNREWLKKAFFDYLTEHKLPIILSRHGRKTALTVCWDLVPYFRESGFIISNNLASQMITEYLRMLQDTGADEAAWKSFQTASDFKASEAEDIKARTQKKRRKLRGAEK